MTGSKPSIGMSGAEFAVGTQLKRDHAAEYDARALAVEEMLAVNRDIGGDWRERNVLSARAAMHRSKADYYRAISRLRDAAQTDIRSCAEEPIAPPTPPQPHPRDQGPAHD